MAQLAHAYVATGTQQTHSGDTSYADISSTSISSSNLTAGHKYLLLAKAFVGSASAAANAGIQLVHGSTAFTHSEYGVEPDNTTPAKVAYRWMTVWTAVSSEGLKLQFATRQSAQAVSAGFCSIFALDLNDLTENTDWKYAEETTPQNLSTTEAGGASITFTPGGSSKWLVIAVSRLTGEDTGENSEMYIKRSGEATSSIPFVTMEGEDAANSNAMVQCVARTFDLTGSSNTFQVFNRNDGATAGQRQQSAIFAINLDKFAYYQVSQPSDASISTTSYGDTIASLTFNPPTTMDAFILAYWGFDCASDNNNARNRLQVGGSDNPSGQTTDDTLISQSWDATDTLPIHEQTLLVNQSSSVAVDIDVSAESAAAANDVLLLAWGLELASSGTSYSEINLLSEVGVTVIVTDAVSAAEALLSEVGVAVLATDNVHIEEVVTGEIGVETDGTAGVGLSETLTTEVGVEVLETDALHAAESLLSEAGVATLFGTEAVSATEQVTEEAGIETLFGTEGFSATESLTEEVGVATAGTAGVHAIETGLLSEIGVDTLGVDLLSATEALLEEAGVEVLVTDAVSLAEALTTEVGVATDGTDDFHAGAGGGNHFSEINLLEEVGAQVVVTEAVSSSEALTTEVGAEVSGAGALHASEVLATETGIFVDGVLSVTFDEEALIEEIGAETSITESFHADESSLASECGIDVLGSAGVHIGETDLLEEVGVLVLLESGELGVRIVERSALFRLSTRKVATVRLTKQAQARFRLTTEREVSL